jgi:hypothetical protein
MFIATNMPGTCTDRFPGMIADTGRYRQGYTGSVKQVIMHTKLRAMLIAANIFMC